MNFDEQLLLEQRYTEICEKFASHSLPKWEALPDIELYMDQVIVVMDKALDLYAECLPEESKLITPSIINNYVKLKVIPAPIKKRYNRDHLAFLIMICILKQTLSISSIVKMLSLQLKNKSVEQLYGEFCVIYEDVIPFVRMDDFITDSVSDKTESNDDMNTFILKSAILSTAGRFICEGMLAAVERDDNTKKEKSSSDEK